ncbi:DUF6499 domain-containing protein [Sphingopyxis sp. GW247-27LB]|uniref:transcriptional regulator domain-containing protein n=1 Tax=Sphingopyxis sp. GW247-27LB TaxID=2012632 RepID=UPI0020D02C52|nr:DUF6499 domain-containing protein [Sphingopyxis sp. GW247-27LB]
MTGGSSWRSPSTADQYRHHDYADFAQEFLQRNTDYRQDYAETVARVATEPRGEHAEQEGLAGRWGLSFPHFAYRRPEGKPSAVVAGRGTGRRCSRCARPSVFGYASAWL